MKINKIEKLYKLKKKNLSKSMFWTMIIKFYNIIKYRIRYKYASVTKAVNEYLWK